MKHFFSWMRGGLLAALVLLGWLVGPAARAQAPAWQMAVAANQTFGTDSQAQAVATDASGNVFIAGSFTGTTSFGNIDLTSAGGSDAFVAKWNGTTGSFIWAQRAGGLGNDYVRAMSVSGNSVYVAGQFQSATAAFGSFSLANAGPANTDDVFIAKLTDSGSFVWAQQAGGSGSDAAFALQVTTSGVYIAGSVSGTISSFGNMALANWGSANTYDAFVAKLIDGGASAYFAWVQRAGGTDSDYATAIAVIGTSVYVAGNFRSPTASFDAFTLTNATLSPPFTDDVFLAKLTDGGTTSTFNWVQHAGGPGYDDAYALAAVGPNLYLTGTFGYLNGAAGPLTTAFGNATLTTTGLSDIFITKLTDAGSSGGFVWAQGAGSALFDTPYGISVAGRNVCVTGNFGGAVAIFGSFSLSNTSSLGYSDVFVTKLIDAGSTANFAWAQQAGGTGSDESTAVALAGTSIYVAGGITSPGIFGNLSLNGPANSQRTFLASLTDPTLLATTAAQSSLSFSLAPNPAHATATATVQLPALPGTPTATLTLRDALGRALRTATVALPAAGLRHELDLTNLPAGIYALQVQAGAATATRRLVVE